MTEPKQQALRLPGPLVLVGCGKMGGALLRGWLARGADPRQISAVDINPVGLDDVRAKGVTIVTHEKNVPFFQKVWARPRTIAPDQLSKAPRPAVFETVSDKKVMTDGTQTLELYHMKGTSHNVANMIVFMPRHGLVFWGDGYNPPAGDPRDPARTPPPRPDALLAPADGRVIVIDQAAVPEELGLGPDLRWRIGIFLSILDVHVSRVPTAGTVSRIAYRSGAFGSESMVAIAASAIS